MHRITGEIGSPEKTKTYLLRKWGTNVRNDFDPVEDESDQDAPGHGNVFEKRIKAKSKL